MQPLVSIIMATYNGERFLREQIDSLIRQSYTKLEIIVQDDGSTDSTIAILNEYASKDSRIVIFENETNLGINKNFYDLISKANGEYIAISDQDDIWDLQKIEILLAKIGAHSLVYTDSMLIDENGERIGPTLLEELGHTPKFGKLLTTLFTHNTISGHACLFSKEIKEPLANLTSHHRAIHCVYDQLIGTLASFRKGVTYVEGPLTLHRIHAQNSCNKLQVNDTFLETTPLSITPKSAEGAPLNFFDRKKYRVRKKIQRAWRKTIFFSRLFDLYTGDEQNPFRRVSYSKEAFKKSFFNRKLYNYLRSFGISKEDAKIMSRGRYYYLFFRFF